MLWLFQLALGLPALPNRAFASQATCSRSQSDTSR